jgi:hypothetical protein
MISTSKTSALFELDKQINYSATAMPTEIRVKSPHITPFDLRSKYEYATTQNRLKQMLQSVAGRIYFDYESKRPASLNLINLIKQYHATRRN